MEIFIRNNEIGQWPTCLTRLDGADWEGDFDRSSFIQLASDMHASTMCLYDLLADGQSQSSPQVLGSDS